MKIVLCLWFVLLVTVARAHAQAEPVTAPSDATLQVVDATATLTWVDNATNESAYHVERKIDQFPWRPLATLDPDSVTYADTVEAGHTYCYRVYATTAWLSAWSNQACTTVPNSTTKPEAPTGVTFDANLVLAWSPVPNALGIHVKCGKKTEGNLRLIADLPASFTVYQVTSYALPEKPRCLVQAWNRSGESPISNIATAPAP